MQVWNAFVGWFVAFTIPRALRHSCCESCPGISAHRATSISAGDKLHDLDDSRSVLGDSRNPNLVDDWSSALWLVIHLRYTGRRYWKSGFFRRGCPLLQSICGCLQAVPQPIPSMNVLIISSCHHSPSLCFSLSVQNSGSSGPSPFPLAGCQSPSVTFSFR